MPIYWSNVLGVDYWLDQLQFTEEFNPDDIVEQKREEMIKNVADMRRRCIYNLFILTGKDYP